MPEVTGTCCLCGEPGLVAYCSLCGHWFDAKCRGDWRRRGAEAFNAFIGNKGNLKCQHPTTTKTPT